MNKQSASSLHFQRKIFDFYQARIFPIASRQEFENIRSYLINLILYRKKRPLPNDWSDCRASSSVWNVTRTSGSRRWRCVRDVETTGPFRRES